MTFRPRIFSTLRIGILILGLTPNLSEAFLYIRGGKYSKGARPVSAAPIWSDRAVQFRVNTDLTAYGGTLSARVTEAEFLRAAQLAIEAWSDVCRSDLVVGYNGLTDLIADSNDAIPVISYDNRASGSNTFGNDQNILAAATTVLQGDAFYDCDIVVNGNISNTTYLGVDGDLTGKYDLVSILAHEVGHCLGLEHPVEPPDYDVDGATDSIKNATILRNATLVQSAVFGTGDTRRRTPNQDDKDAIDCMYERGKPFRNGTSCTSYHGTNGGSTISGTVSGGPLEERGDVCGAEGDARTVEGKENETTTGCIGSAFASGKEKSLTPSRFFNVWFFLLFFGAVRIFLRKRSFQR
jgi:hypothetical protein